MAVEYEMTSTTLIISKNRSMCNARQWHADSAHASSLTKMTEDWSSLLSRNDWLSQMWQRERQRRRLNCLNNIRSARLTLAIDKMSLFNQKYELHKLICTQLTLAMSVSRWMTMNKSSRWWKSITDTKLFNFSALASFKRTEQMEKNRESRKFRFWSILASTELITVIKRTVSKMGSSESDGNFDDGLSVRWGRLSLDPKASSLGGPRGQKTDDVSASALTSNPSQTFSRRR